MTILEVLIASAILLAFVGGMLEVMRRAQHVSRYVPDAADAQQAVRVAAEALRRDLLLAGDGPEGPLMSDMPPLRPADIAADPELSFADDRITILYVPTTQARARPALPVMASDSVIYLRGGWQCSRDAACGFAGGMRVLLLARSASPAPHELFTVSTTGTGWISRDPAGGALSRDYAEDGALLTEATQRVYSLDRSDPANMKLKRAEAGQSAFPLLDHVTLLEFRYYADEGELTAAALTDGPILGSPPNQFDADLLRVRRVRVRIGASAGQPRNAFASDFQIAFDVAPPNMTVAR
jgi:hypothetical protein